jgi:hypothetical protein
MSFPESTVMSQTRLDSTPDRSCPPSHWRGLGSLWGRVNWLPFVVLSLVSVQADEPENLILTAADGWPVHVSYYNTRSGRANKEASVVVLVTAANGDEAGVTRRVWNELAVHLQKNGFVVLSVDLRKHGDSLWEGSNQKNANKVRTSDYRDMVLGDMEAVKAFLLQKHQAKELNVRKLGIVTSGASGLVGAAFALNDWSKPPYVDAPTLIDRTPRGQDVRAIVMISPRRTKGFNAAKVLKRLANPNLGIAIRIYHSSRDEAEKKIAQQFCRFVDLKGEEYDGLRSIDEKPVSAESFLDGKTGQYFRPDLTAFLKTNLDELTSPWKSRISKLDR